MPYSEIAPKQKRIIEKDTETLFSPAAFITKPTLEDIKRLGFFHPTIKYNRGTHFLSEKGASALRRITDILAGLAELSQLVSRRDIDHYALSGYNELLVGHLQPTGQEFIEGRVNALLAAVKDYEFLIKIEGLDIKDQNVVELGPVRIQRSNRALFENVRFGETPSATLTYDQFKDSLWLIGAARGTDDVAREKFEYQATIAVGILAICGALLYRGSIWRTRVRAVISPLEHRDATVLLMWERGGDNPSVTRRCGWEQDLPLGSNSIALLTQRYLLKQLASLSTYADQNELQQAIVRALYWFADAYRDRNRTMQFVKLWTCAECFFAIDEQGVTELNAKGLAAILKSARLGIPEATNYANLKRRAKALYGLRSKALHRASFGHIQTADLDDLSYWIASVIVSMVLLSERGYQTLEQIRQLAEQIDQKGFATGVHKGTG